MHADVQSLLDQYDAIDRDAHALVAGLDPAAGTWRAAPGAWSVAQCLDHLATANRVYLAAMTPPARQALARGRGRRRPARPGLVGGWFVRSLEPPPARRTRLKAPRLITPREDPALDDSAAAFFASQRQVRDFAAAYADIDLAGVRFPNPFIPGLRFSLATGLHVIAAHARRHLWQAHQVSAQFTVHSAQLQGRSATP